MVMLTKILGDFSYTLLITLCAGAIGTFLQVRFKVISKIITNFQLIKCILSSGMKNFYFNREMLHKQLGPIGNEIAKAKQEFIYIGYSMSDVINQNIGSAIINSIRKNNVKFIFCILDKNCSTIDMYSAYTGKSKEIMISSLKETEKNIGLIKDNLSSEEKENIKILKHNLFLPSSCFLVDSNSEMGFIHFNYKSPKSVKFNDFGFIFKNRKNTSEFYKGLNHGYREVIKAIEDYTKSIQTNQ